uniref:CSON004276 protein n=1 Tax=Culicoides sonorensis TaxID=179676 RepID=A0A336N177_CULSO
MTNYVKLLTFVIYIYVPNLITVTCPYQLNPDDVPDSISRIAGPTPLSSSNNNNNDTYHIGNVPLRRFQQVKSVMQPVFIDHENRQFLNPISYIGGPRLDSNGRQQIDRTNRNSIDSITSILSID